VQRKGEGIYETLGKQTYHKYFALKMNICFEDGFLIEPIYGK